MKKRRNTKLLIFILEITLLSILLPINTEINNDYLRYTDDTEPTNMSILNTQDVLYNNKTLIVNNVYNDISSFVEDEEKSISESIYEYFKNLTYNVVSEAYENKEVSKECYDSIIYSYTNEVNEYIYKLLIDSAKNKNDLGSYNDCIKINYEEKKNGETRSNILPNITYNLVAIYRGNVVNSDFKSQESDYLIGICVRTKCTPEEYSKMVFEYDRQTNKSLQLDSSTDIVRVIGTRDEITIANTNVYYFLSLIPFFLAMILLLFVLFPDIPVFIFGCCFTKKRDGLDNNYSRGSDSSPNNTLQIGSNKKGSCPHLEPLTSEYSGSDEEIRNRKQRYTIDRNLYYRFKKAWSFTDNLDEFMSLDTKENKSKYSMTGLEHLKGLKAISMILTTIGFTFMHLFCSPLKIYSSVKMEDLLKTMSFTFISAGIRFCPKLLMAYSGYILIFKLTSFLDEAVLKECSKNDDENNVSDSLNNNSSESNNNNNNNNNDNSNNKEGDNENDESVLSESNNNITRTTANNIIKNIFKSEQTENNVHDIFNSSNSYIVPEMNQVIEIPNKIFFKFFLLKIHRYFVFIWNAFFFGYSFYYVIGFLYWSLSPMWIYYKHKFLIKFQKTLLETTLLVDTFTSYKELNVFNMAINEMVFFLIFSALIFSCYKRKWRLDVILLLAFPIMMAVKIGHYYLINYNSTHNKTNTCPECGVHGQVLNTLFFFHDINGFMQFHPFTCVTSYIVGIYFGMLNYIHEKRIDKETIKASGLTYLYHFYNVNNFFYSRRRSCFFWFSLIMCILVLLASCLWFYVVCAVSNTSMRNVLENFTVNMIMNFDVEVFVISLLLLIYLLSFSSNFIMAFISHNYWSLLSKTYFVFLMILNPAIMFVFYQSESRIKVGIFNIIFFSIFIIMMIFVADILGYMIQEMPFKKLSRLFVNRLFRKKTVNLDLINSFNANSGNNSNINNSRNNNNNNCNNNNDNYPRNTICEEADDLTLFERETIKNRSSNNRTSEIPKNLDVICEDNKNNTGGN